MIQAVMLNQEARPQYWDGVYTPEVLTRLSACMDIYPSLIHNGSLKEHSQALENAEVLLASWGMPIWDETVLACRMPRLKAVFYGAGTVKYFAAPFISRGVRVMSAWFANGVPVADYTAAQILLANKGYYRNLRLARTDYAGARAFSGSCKGNYGAKAGIIGTGMIGAMVAERLKPYDIDVLAYSPHLTPEKAARLGVRSVGLDELFSTCDVVTNHVAHLPETEGLINYALLSKMPPYSTFINTGRGAQVVEADLIRALTEDPSRSALLDVTDPEPAPRENPIWKLENVFITSHIAGSTGREMERLGVCVCEEVERYAAGMPLKYEVTAEMLKTMA